MEHRTRPMFLLLLLRGLDAPQIDPGNSLWFKLTGCLHTTTRRMRLRQRDPHQVVAHRKVFGGEEERGILGNFPEDK